MTGGTGSATGGTGSATGGTGSVTGGTGSATGDAGPPPVPRIALTPRPHDPGHATPSPAVSASTRQRVEHANRERAAALVAAEPGRHVRTTIALALATAALATAWRLFGGRGE